MKVLNTREEIRETAIAEKIKAGSIRTHSTKYPDHVEFECGCGGRHRVNKLFREDIIGYAMPVKFLLSCPCDYITFVQIKGWFMQKATAIFSCKRIDFVDATAPKEA